MEFFRKLERKYQRYAIRNLMYYITILYAIGLSEVMYNAKIYVGRTMESFATYTWVAVFFLLIVTVLSFISRYVERRMNA